MRRFVQSQLMMFSVNHASGMEKVLCVGHGRPSSDTCQAADHQSEPPSQELEVATALTGPFVQAVSPLCCSHTNVHHDHSQNSRLRKSQTDTTIPRSVLCHMSVQRWFVSAVCILPSLPPPPSSPPPSSPPPSSPSSSSSSQPY